MSAPSDKKQRTLPQLELLYHPSIPGRGEYIRLALEAAGATYTDVASEVKGGYGQVQKAMGTDSIGDDDGNPPAFAPPMLRVPGAGVDGKALLIHQTFNILLYLSSYIGLAPEDEPGKFHANQIALTALDLSDEAHDTHHPVASYQYYEDQKSEALKTSEDFRDTRIPKFFSYFERILKGNEKAGKGKYLVGSKLSYADTTVWQVLDGLHFAFPKELAARKKDYPLLMDTFYPSFKEENGIKDYLASKRRLPYSMGVFRHYPELDRQ